MRQRALNQKQYDSFLERLGTIWTMGSTSKLASAELFILYGFLGGLGSYTSWPRKEK